MPRHRRKSNVTAVAISLLVTATLSVIVARYTIPLYQRWRVLEQLLSDDPAVRERSLNFVLRYAADNPDIRGGAVRRLPRADDAQFRELAYFLDKAGLWDRATVGDASWLRWLGLALKDDNPESRIASSQNLAQLVDLAGDPRLVALLTSAIHDDNADVRYNTLTASALLRGAAGEESEAYDKIIESTLHDKESAVARHAWIYAGLLRVLSPEVLRDEDWKTADKSVAQAMIWAIARITPERPEAVVGVLSDPRADPALRQTAAFALSQSLTPDARVALGEAYDSAQSDPVLRLRCLLASDTLLDQPKPVIGEGGDRADDALLAAWWFRAAQVADAQHPFDPTAMSPLDTLAYIEGSPPGKRWEHTGEWPVLTCVTAWLGSPGLDRALVEPALRSDDPTMRDLACVAASKCEDVLDMATKLLKTFDENARLSGVIVAGLAGVRPTGTLRDTGQKVDLLDYVSQYPDWRLGQYVRLADWLQGRLNDEQATAKHVNPALSLLIRKDLPRSTLLLVSLERDLPGTLDALLVPQGEADVDALLDLFVAKRWWHVLEPHLPDDAPRLWLWGDEGLQRFQIELLREWWVLNRSAYPHTP
ncbi:MAG: hypothetical protein GC164_11720 [Phycisphaera sp.]|nr:hypothetical protein [Phycisphaera sp.]